MAENIISDEKLVKFFEEEKIKNILNLFSSGNFSGVINKYFMSEEKSSQTPTPESNTTPKTPTPNIMFSNMNVNNNAQKQPQPKLVLNLELLEKCNEDKLTQQILLTIIIFCLLKANKMEEAKTIFEKYVFTLEKIIFPLILLKAKYFIKIKNTPKAIDIYSESINIYNDYLSSEENKNDTNNIITIETYHQNFKYFKNVFNYLFALNNIDSKIKKLYLELKFCLNSLKFYSQAYQLILELYQKYPNDIQIMFELAKDSITFSKIDKYQEMIEVMKKRRDNENDGKKKLIFNNFILYAQALYQVAQGKIDLSQNTFSEILKTDPGNPLILNNSALLNIYKNNPKECYNNLIQLYTKGNDSSNETIKNTINFIAEKFNFPKLQ
jgi:tetratricopeptide (TPR) repeat protein